MKHTQKGHFQRIPWWIFILIATVLYVGLTYFAPTLQSEIPLISTFLHIAPSLAPIGTILFLLLGAKALYDSPEEKVNTPDSKKSDD
jgi:hypothetical protein